MFSSPVVFYEVLAIEYLTTYGIMVGGKLKQYGPISRLVRTVCYYNLRLAQKIPLKMGEKRRNNMENFNDFDSSDDDLDFRIYDENINRDISSDGGSDIIPVKRVSLRIVSDTKESTEMKNDVSDDDEWIDVIEEPAEETINSDGEWEDATEQEYVPFKIDFKTSLMTTGPQISDDIKEPIDFFLNFTDELIHNIITETNEYANTKIQGKELSKRSIWRSWIDVNREEFLAFIGVIFNMGTMPLANFQEYWSTRYNSKIPFYSETFTRDRFLQIFWMLHLKKTAPYDNSLSNRIIKVSDFLKFIDDRFSDFFFPGQDICVDESVVKFKGRVCFITYNPFKPTKWGIRIYVLADSDTGYIYSILPYDRNLTLKELIRSDLPVSTRIPLHLFKTILDQNPNAEGYHMYTDRYYTSIPLADELLKMKCHLTGTIKSNRKYLPRAIRRPRFAGKKTVAFRKDKT